MLQPPTNLQFRLLTANEWNLQIYLPIISRPPAGTSVQALSAVNTYVVPLHGASSLMSAWVVSVFDQGFQMQTMFTRRRLSNTVGTFAAAGAADTSALSSVQLSSIAPGKQGKGLGWIPISGGVVVTLRTYPHPYGSIKGNMFTRSPHPTTRVLGFRVYPTTVLLRIHETQTHIKGCKV